MRKRSVLTVGLVGLLSVALMLPLLAAPNPTHIRGAAAKSCQQLADQYASSGTIWHEVKVTPPATSGDDETLFVTLENLSSLSFDWEADSEGPAVDAVFVKSGSQGSNLYIYQGQSYGDTGLKPPATQAISHILFCYSGIPANQAPVATDDDHSVPQDTALTVAAPGVLGNDTDGDGDSLSAALVAGPTNGSLGESGLSGDGSFTYTPDTGFSGSDSFTYQTNDGTADSNVATVTIEVQPTLTCGDDTDLSAEGQPSYVVRPENGDGSCAKTFTFEASEGTEEGNQFVTLIATGEGGPVVFLEYLEFLPQAPNPESASLIGLDLYYDDNLDDEIEEKLAKLCLEDPRVMDGGPLFNLHADYDTAEESSEVLPEGETTCIISAEFVTTGSDDSGPLVKASYYLYNVGDGFRTFK
ncbi:MAG: cadherin-like domain-containing protein [Acidimicrobiia bacterium]